MFASKISYRTTTKRDATQKPGIPMQYLAHVERRGPIPARDSHQVAIIRDTVHNSPVHMYRRIFLSGLIEAAPSHARDDEMRHI